MEVLPLDGSFPSWYVDGDEGPNTRFSPIRPFFAALSLLAASSACDEAGEEYDPPIELDDDEVVYADLFPALGSGSRIEFRGRIVREEREDIAEIDESTPLGAVSQDEVKRYPIEVRLEGNLFEARTDEEGTFALAADPRSLAPGLYTYTVGPRRRPEKVWGKALARILPAAGPAIVVTSDIDLTYLETRFQGTRDVARLLAQSASEKKPFAGAPELYRALVSSGHALVFLSGSPLFFKRTLEARFRLDSVEVSGLVLKDMRPALQAVDLEALKAQIPYKLAALLAMRRDMPSATVQILVGDDSEADFIVYPLYRDVLAGTLSADDLALRLQQLGVERPDRERLSRAAREFATTPNPGAVPLILIRRSGFPSEDHAVEPWLDSNALAVADSWIMALVLADRGTIEDAELRSVKEAMVRSGTSPERLEAQAEIEAKAGRIRAETARRASR